MLKQGKGEPVPVEKQVAILYAVVHGILTKVEVKEIKKYEEELYHFLDSDAEAVNVMQAIVSTGKLDEESEKKLNDSLTRFTEEFLKRL